MIEVVKYTGESNILSIFSRTQLICWIGNFNCVEQAYQCRKATFFHQGALADRVYQASLHREMKMLTQHLHSPVWDAEKYDTMLEIVRAEPVKAVNSEEPFCRLRTV